MKTERIGIRITPELKKALELLANEENRSFSNYIETLLKDHVQNRTGSAAIRRHGVQLFKRDPT